MMDFMAQIRQGGLVLDSKALDFSVNYRWIVGSREWDLNILLHNCCLGNPPGHGILEKCVLALGMLSCLYRWSDINFQLFQCQARRARLCSPCRRRLFRCSDANGSNSYLSSP